MEETKDIQPMPNLPIGIEADTGIKKVVLNEMKTDLKEASVVTVAKEVAKVIVETKVQVDLTDQ